MKLLEIRWD